jgi:peptide deformylase
MTVADVTKEYPSAARRVSIGRGARRDVMGDQGPNDAKIDGMAIRDIRIIGDPVLRTACEPITRRDKRVHDLVADLLETVDMEGRAGLAANQIGVGLRAFSYNVEDELGYVLNPRIVELSEEHQDGDEGCLSVPGLWFPARRAFFARVVGEDLDGNEVMVEGTELMARCLQHEVDHLDGKLYLDRLDRAVRKKAMQAVRDLPLP